MSFTSWFTPSSNHNEVNKKFPASRFIVYLPTHSGSCYLRCVVPPPLHKDQLIFVFLANHKRNTAMHSSTHKSTKKKSETLTRRLLQKHGSSPFIRPTTLIATIIKKGYINYISKGIHSEATVVLLGTLIDTVITSIFPREWLKRKKGFITNPTAHETREVK